MASTGHSARILASPQLQALAGNTPCPPLPFLRGTLTPAWHGTSHVSSPRLALQRDMEPGSPHTAGPGVASPGAAR